MKSIAGTIIVTLMGLLTFAATVVGVVVIERLTGFNLFTLSFWVVIPAGALLCGAAAASGFYFGSLWTHTRPTPFTLIGMLLIAAFAQISIYYAEYRTFTLDDGQMASDVVTFGQYLDAYLSTMHMRVGRGAQVDTGEMGSFGYFVAVLQFVAFILGGIAMFIFLWTYPTCETCTRYLRTLAKGQKKFANQDDFTAFYDGMFEVPVDGPEFAALMKNGEKVKDEKGTILSDITLRGGPHCRTQRISQEVKVNNGKEYKEVKALERNVRIPNGVNLVPVFKTA